MKPMLAGKADPKKDLVEQLKRLAYPRFVAPKLDGIRAVGHHGQLLSRTLKAIPNRATSRFFGSPHLHGFDGELIVGEPTDPEVYTNTDSGVSTENGDPNARLFVFDLWVAHSVPYSARLKELARYRKGLHKPLRDRVVLLPQTLVDSYEGLLEAEQEYLDRGYEGIMTRTVDGPYKYGRSTFLEGTLVKIKRFEDSEFVVSGWEPLKKNTNEAKVNAVGATKRSSHKAGKVDQPLVGVLKGTDIASGKPVAVGAGISMKLREELYRRATDPERGGINGLIVKYAFFAYGTAAKPRQPVFKGFRHAFDL